ncbi:MAG: NAD(P)-dependent oxidoreductase [Spirochaetes bacterium]|jgi:nucleoside-diphosphate-sugar epimerase|nr:NAD(P)-dependent oxidoreductase [Spirochaetota bacterium]
MKILITGTDGFIGSNLKSGLQRIGHDVHGTVFIRKAGKNEYLIDVRRPETFKDLPDIKYDALIHTAGIVDQTMPRRLMMDVNAGGTKNLLEWASAKCGHFIQMSSICVYGLKTLGMDRTEKSTKRYEGIFAIPYMRSKSLAERHIEASGIPYSGLRLPPVLGRSDTYLSPAIIRFLREGSFAFCGSGEKLLSVILVKNLTGIVGRVLEKGPLNDSLNCADHHVPWREFVGEYARNLGLDMPFKKRRLASLLIHPLDKQYQLMITFSSFGAHFPSDRLMGITGYTPENPWQDGVMEAIEGSLSAVH